MYELAIILILLWSLNCVLLTNRAEWWVEEWRNRDFMGYLHWRGPRNENSVSYAFRKCDPFSWQTGLGFFAWFTPVHFPSVESK